MTKSLAQVIAELEGFLEESPISGWNGYNAERAMQIIRSQQKDIELLRNLCCECQEEFDWRAREMSDDYFSKLSSKITEVMYATSPDKILE